MAEPTLSDFGERRLVREILPKYCALAGDDCAALQVVSGTLLVTTDPVPEPAAKLLGGDDDPYWMGWLLATINFSDIAAAGAEPVAFVAAIEAPPNLPLAQFERLLAGIGDACKHYNARYAGGNLREGSVLGATGTALGICTNLPSLTRKGATAGDVLVSVGQGGIFWRDVMHLRQGGSLAVKAESPVFRPLAKTRQMMALQKRQAAKASIDNSDGLLPTLAQLAQSSAVSVELDLARLQIPGLGPASDLSARLWLGWGDWNVIVAVPPAMLDLAIDLVAGEGGMAVQIGQVKEGEPGVTLIGQSGVAPAPRLESERFSHDSWFARGVESYISSLFSIELPS